MPLPTRKRLLRFLLLAALAGVMVLALTPLAVASGVRAWVRWKAAQQKFKVTIDKIESPFLKPVSLVGVRLTSPPDAPVRVDLTVPRATVSLNLRSVLLRTRGRAVRALALEGLRGELHRERAGSLLDPRGWNVIQKILPARLTIEKSEVRLDDNASVMVLRGLSLTANEIETGRCSITEIMISSPAFRQTFRNLRGATNWQADRLTVGGLSLARGLDLQTMTLDLSRLSKQHVGFEFDLDVFGGKIRANVGSDWRADRASWNLIGSASDISLAQTSEAMGFMDRMNGVLHAGKFTFRGDLGDPAQATASLWAELTAVSWRNRAADVLMLGAALNNRQIQLQQLYVKQRDNQLTLNGEAALPAQLSEWLNTDFRGNISASITNLGDFASLFGADPKQFGGALFIEGTMDTGGRKIGGHLTATGENVSIWRTPVDRFAAKVNLKASELEIEQLELHRKNDWLRGTGKLDLGAEKKYSATANFSAQDVAPYLHLLPFSWNRILTAGMASGDWNGTGNAKSHSGSFRVTGRNWKVVKPIELQPFNAELDASYGPGSLFFRHAHLANERASLNGFFTFASNYVQMQAMAFDLNDKPILRGSAFVPVSLWKMLRGASFVDSLDRAQKVDLDLAIEPLDLGEFDRALAGRETMSGRLSARVSAFGGLDALQGWSNLKLQEVAWNNEPATTTAEMEMKLASGTLNANGRVQFRGSEAIAIEAALPVRLGEEAPRIGQEPVSAQINFPRVNLGRLPRLLQRDLFRDGTLSGKLTIAEKWGHPSCNGEAQLVKAKLNRLIKSEDLSARVTFNGRTASIDSLTLGSKGNELSLKGNADYSEANRLKLALISASPLYDVSAAKENNCVAEIKAAPKTAEPPSAKIQEIQIIGDLAKHEWQGHLSLQEGAPGKARQFRLCPQGDAAQGTLLLAAEPSARAARPSKRSRSR